MNIANITLDEVRANYLEHLGFIFLSNQKSSDEAIANLCQVLKDKAITKSDPSFIGRINDNTTVFAYENDFDMPSFLFKSNIANQTKMFYVTSIRKFFMDLDNKPTTN
jgi:hypothetical protein